MAVQKGVLTKSYKAGGTIGKYEPVKLGTNTGEVIVPAADSDLIIGVSMIDAEAGQEVSVAYAGTVKMRVGAAGILKGDKVGLDATDPTEVIAYNSANNDQVIGIAEIAESVDEYTQVALSLNTKTA